MSLYIILVITFLVISLFAIHINLQIKKIRDVRRMGVKLSKKNVYYKFIVRYFVKDLPS